MDKKMKIKAKKKQFSLFVLVGLIVFSIFALMIFLPMVWAVLTSFKEKNDFDDNFFGLPQKWVFTNYEMAFRYFRVQNRSTNNVPVYIPEMLWNTILYAGVGTLVCVLCHYIVAYCTAKFPYKFSGFIYSTVLIIMVIPIIGDAAARIQFVDSLGMYDNWPGFFFQRFGFTGMYFLIMHETIKAIPGSISDAAEIDGAGHLQIMWKIILPQVLNMLGVVFLITFMGQWNEYQFAILYMPSHPTLAYGLHSYNNSGFNEVARSFPLKLTGCMLLFFPMLIVFILFHDKMMGNLSMGGVKE